MGMLWLSILGIAINGAAFVRIKQSGHHHGHTHSHDPNSKAIMLHLLEDVLGWIAVLIGSILIYFTGWYIIDSILAIAIALFIAFNAGRNLLDTFRILLQASPAHINLDALSRELLQVKGVKAIHNLHIWSLNGRDHVGSLHFIPTALSEVVMEEAKKEIRIIMHRNNISNITIQVDMNEEACRAEESIE
jgi:cobalt-zinc-cadmium efflux system protein